MEEKGFLDRLQDWWSSHGGGGFVQVGGSGTSGGVWLGQSPGPTWAQVVIGLLVLIVLAILVGRR